MRKMASRVEGTGRVAGGRSQTLVKGMKGMAKTRDGEDRDVNKQIWGDGDVLDVLVGWWPRG